MKCALLGVGIQASSPDEAIGDSDDLLICLIHKIDELCQKGPTDFYTNLRYGVNLWCAEIVAVLKMEYLNISLHAVVSADQPPCADGDIYRWRYDDVIKACDSVICLQEESDDGTDPASLLDLYMIKLADTVLAVNSNDPTENLFDTDTLLRCVDITQKQIVQL